jgi:multiple sugar transport system substrate-binding protein
MKRCFIHVVLFLTSACFAYAATADSVTVEFWNGFTGPDGRYLQKVIDVFNAEYQGRIKVNMVTMVWDDYYSKLALAVRTEHGPDVGVVHYDNMAIVIYQGIVMDLNPYIGEFPKTDFVKSAWNVSSSDGHQYGIPLDFHPLVLYWNKDLFAQIGLDPEKPPSNRTEFLDVCKAFQKADLKKNGQKVWPCMIPSTHPHFLLWLDILFCNGGDMCNPQYTKAIYDSPAGCDALRFLYDLIYKYKYSPPNVIGLPGSDAMDSFMRGNLAMMTDGIWMLTPFKETKNLNFGVKAMINLGTKEHKIWTGSHTMVLFKKRKPDNDRIKASLTFLQYVSEHSYEWAHSGMLPVRYSVLHSKQFAELPYLPQIAADIDKFTFPQSSYKYPECMRPLAYEYLSLCLLNKLDPNSALHKAAANSTARISHDLD